MGWGCGRLRTQVSNLHLYHQADSQGGTVTTPQPLTLHSGLHLKSHPHCTQETDSLFREFSTEL